MHFKSIIFIALTISIEGAVPPKAQEIIAEIRFADHRFTPQALVVHANQPLQIRIINSSHEKIEFESFRLNREKVIEPGESVTLRLPALHAGSYDFYDDFHQDVPEGALIAK